MSAFEELSLSRETFSGKVRLFPLPNLVLFPHVIQPLHIFEPRYRQLLADALSGDRLIAMAVLTPGWEKNYEGRPTLYSMACLGRIAAHHQLADGSHNILLLGLQRARLLRELKSRRSFREAEVELCDDVYPAGSSTRQDVLQEKLRDALLAVLPGLPDARDQLDQLLGNDIPLGVLTDVVAYILDINIFGKQTLLSEVDVCRRAELLLRHLRRTARAMVACPACAGFPPTFSVN